MQGFYEERISETLISHLLALENILLELKKMNEPKKLTKEEIALRIFTASVSCDSLLSQRVDFDVREAFRAADEFIKQRDQT